MNARRLLNVVHAAMDRMGYDVDRWLGQPKKETAEAREQRAIRTYQERLANWGTDRESVQQQQQLMNFLAARG